MLEILGFISGIGTGYFLPDIDLKLFFLTHRSIFTHSIAILLFFYAIYRVFPLKIYGSFVAGIGLGLGIHLSFDFFPKNFNYYRHANIFIPFFGSMGKFFSPLWIFMNAYFSVFISHEIVARLNKPSFNFLYLISSFLAGMFFYIREPKQHLFLFFTNAFAGLILFCSIFFFAYVFRKLQNDYNSGRS